jgi:hypothetical protein
LSLEKFISKVIDNNSVINSSISGCEISISNDLVSIVNDQPTDSKTSTASSNELIIHEESVTIVEDQSVKWFKRRLRNQQQASEC